MKQSNHGGLAGSAASAQLRAGIAPRALLRALRPRQWIKNGLLLVPLAFSLSFLDPLLLARAVAAAIFFCGLSSAGYLLNDVADVEADRRHPTKRLRPIASGEV